MQRRLLLAILSIPLLVISCEDNQQPVVKENIGTLVAATPSAPADGITVDLDEFSPVSFEWDGGSWDGFGFVAFDIIFDRAEGDFSKPIAAYYASSPADSVKTLSKDAFRDIFLAAANGTKVKKVDVKWVIRTKGGGKYLASSPRAISIKMTPEPDQFSTGDPMYIAGEGADEAGRKFGYFPLGRTIPSTYKDKDGVEYNYEIYTQLSGGKGIYFWAGETTGDRDWYFCPVAGTALNKHSTMVKSIKKDADSTAFTVPDDGVYRIRLNSTTNDVLVQKVTNNQFRLFSVNKNAGGSWAAHLNATLTYVSDGIWKAEDVEMRWGGDSFETRNSSYKFIITIGGSVQQYGYLDGTISAQAPSDKNIDDKYWAVIPVVNGAAASAWSLPLWLIDESDYVTKHGDVLLHFSLDDKDFYWHEIVEKP